MRGESDPLLYPRFTEVADEPDPWVHYMEGRGCAMGDRHGNLLRQSRWCLRPAPAPDRSSILIGVDSRDCTNHHQWRSHQCKGTWMQHGLYRASGRAGLLLLVVPAMIREAAARGFLWWGVSLP